MNMNNSSRRASAETGFANGRANNMSPSSFVKTNMTKESDLRKK